MELWILGEKNMYFKHHFKEKKRLQSSTAAESEQRFPLCVLLWNNQQHAECQAALLLKYNHQESDIIWAARYMILLWAMHTKHAWCDRNNGSLSTHWELQQWIWAGQWTSKFKNQPYYSENPAFSFALHLTWHLLVFFRSVSVTV